MNRVAAALIAVTLALGAASFSDASSLRPERGAKLTVIDSKPLTLRGTRFLPREKVRLTVVAGKNRTVRHTTAGRTGSFTQRFPSLTADRCGRLTAVASGSRGSRASTKIVEPACPPPLRGPA